MAMKKITEELYLCDKCQNTCLKDKVCSKFPEPLIGNCQARFAILGINPGRSDRTFADEKEYVDYYSDSKRCGLDLKECWQIGYFLAYNRLVNSESTLDDFNKDAVILNVIKCSTENIREICRNDLQKAKENCKDYLARQLEAIKPKVILSHGKFACSSTIDMLRHEKKYAVVSDSSSCSIDALAQKNMDEISKEHIMLENEDRCRILFLFNKHLSLCPIAMESLDKNFPKKSKLVSDLLH
jgi:uracil-DNA glycosylase